MAANGAAGFIHRFMDIDEHAQQVITVAPGPAVGVIGVNGDSHDRAAALYEAGVDAFCVDVAHGHLEKTLSMVEHLDEEYGIDIIAGNIATPSAAYDLFDAGADTVKVGIGPGSACTTREKTGVGVPQITAIDDVSRRSRDGTYVIADGGMKTPGDVAKAIMAGADGAMLGSYFASCDAAPQDGVIRGMASEAAQSENGKSEISEGGTKSVGSGDRVSEKVQELKHGLQSAASYCGEDTLAAARDNAKFIKVTPNTVERNGLH
jgi:IMP dehydrogenase